MHMAPARRHRVWLYLCPLKDKYLPSPAQERTPRTAKEDLDNIGHKQVNRQDRFPQGQPFWSGRSVYAAEALALHLPVGLRLASLRLPRLGLRLQVRRELPDEFFPAGRGHVSIRWPGFLRTPHFRKPRGIGVCLRDFIQRCTQGGTYICSLMRVV